jgi:hypothetical protein
MKNISVAIVVMLFLWAATALPQEGRSNTTWIIPITFSNTGYPTCKDTFGVGIGYTLCIDKTPGLPYTEIEFPPCPPWGGTDARFVDFSGFEDINCHGGGVWLDIHAGSYTHAMVDTFQYQFQVEDKNVPWYLTWDTTNIHRKLSSLVIQDVATGGFLLNLDMTMKDSITFTKTSTLKNSVQFYIFATWKPIDSAACADCIGPKLGLSSTSIDYGHVPAGFYMNKVLRIKNQGDLPLSISDITSTPSVFTVSGDTRVIAPWDSASYMVRFTPENEGLSSGFVIITSNAPTSPDTISLIGNLTMEVRSPRDIPHSFSLHQNYPNPFNPGTLIKYDLPSRAYVTLKVYNMLGQEVAVLANGEQEPGYKSVKFETASAAGGLPSGVYMYRLTARQETGGQAGTLSDTKKMLLIR